MENRKVWKMIQLLSAKEQKAFIYWMKGEFDGVQYYLNRLGEFLTAKSSAPTSLEVWQHLYPNRAYDDGRLRKLCGDLTRILEEFLAIQAFRKDPRAVDSFLLGELNRRQEPGLFVKLLNRIERRLAKVKNRDALFYRQLYELESEKQGFEVKNRKQLAPKNSPMYSLFWEKADKYQKLNYAFDSWWLNEKMSLTTKININAELKSGRKIESALLPQVLILIDQHPIFSKQIWLTIYKNLYLLLKGEPRLKGSTITQFVKFYEKEFAFEDRQSVLFLLLNFYIKELNTSGSEDAAKEIYNLYDWGVEEKLIFQDNYLLPIHYKNLVNICLTVKDYNSAWKYLHEFKPHLPPDQREDIYYLRLALYYVRQGQYQEVIQTLSNRKFSIITDELNARSFLLEAQYELNKEDLNWLSNRTENLIRYIRNLNELNKQVQQAHLNRYKLFKRLLKAFTENDLRKLEMAVKKADPIDRPDWLLEKISERLQKTIY